MNTTKVFAKPKIPASQNKGSGVAMNRRQGAGDNNVQQAGTIRRTRSPGLCKMSTRCQKVSEESEEAAAGIVVNEISVIGGGEKQRDFEQTKETDLFGKKFRNDGRRKK
jgi:hypothetical protein